MENLSLEIESLLSGIENNDDLDKSIKNYTIARKKIILFKNELKKITNKFKEIQEIEVKNTDKKNFDFNKAISTIDELNQKINDEKSLNNSLIHFENAHIIKKNFEKYINSKKLEVNYVNN
tara:strand:+ start:261 stop:623 length:363 start_codon:yes stop_codon:yes gene_type:complete